MNEFGMGKNYATDLWKLCQFNTIHAFKIQNQQENQVKIHLKTKNQYKYSLLF